MPVFSALAFHLRQKLFLDGFQLARIEGCNLADTKRNIAHDEFFEILVENSLPVIYLSGCFPARNISDANSGMLMPAMSASASAAALSRNVHVGDRKHQRIGNDGCAEQSCDVPGAISSSFSL